MGCWKELILNDWSQSCSALFGTFLLKQKIIEQRLAKDEMWMESFAQHWVYRSARSECS